MTYMEQIMRFSVKFVENFLKIVRPARSTCVPIITFIWNRIMLSLLSIVDICWFQGKCSADYVISMWWLIIFQDTWKTYMLVSKKQSFVHIVTKLTKIRVLYNTISRRIMGNMFFFQYDCLRGYCTSSLLSVCIE